MTLNAIFEIGETLIRNTLEKWLGDEYKIHPYANLEVLSEMIEDTKKLSKKEFVKKWKDWLVKKDD